MLDLIEMPIDTDNEKDPGDSEAPASVPALLLSCVGILPEVRVG